MTTPELIEKYLRRRLTHQERLAMGVIANLLAEIHKEVVKAVFDVRQEKKKLEHEIQMLEMQRFVEAWLEAESETAILGRAYAPTSESR
jgi:hypothetical protein